MLAAFTAVTLILLAPPPVPELVTQTAITATDDRTLPVGGHGRRLRSIPGAWEWAIIAPLTINAPACMADIGARVAARGPPYGRIDGRCPAGFEALSGRYRPTERSMEESPPGLAPGGLFGCQPHAGERMTT